MNDHRFPHYGEDRLERARQEQQETLVEEADLALRRTRKNTWGEPGEVRGLEAKHGLVEVGINSANYCLEINGREVSFDGEDPARLRDLGQAILALAIKVAEVKRG